MIYVLIELNGYKQLIRVRPEVVDRIVENLKGLVGYAGGRTEFYENGVALFSIDPVGSGAPALCELVHHIYEVLLEKRRELHGFVMIAEQVSGSAATTIFPVLGKLRTSALLVDRIDSLWFGRKLWQFLGECFVGEDASDLVRIVGRAAGSREAIDDPPVFLLRPRLVERISNAIEGRLKGSGPAGWIRLVAPPASGIETNIGTALVRFAGDKRFDAWARLGSGRDSLTTLEPFLGAIRPEFLAAVPEFLSKSDRVLWEQRIGILQFSCPDHAVEDFVSVFSLYLLAYVRSLRRRRLPAVLICPAADRYPDSTIALLYRILARFTEFGTLVAVCVTKSNEPLGELERFPHETIVVDPLSSEEIRERTNKCPDLASLDAGRLEEATKRQALYVYHACVLGKLGKQEGIQISLELLRRRDVASRRILYTIHATRGLLSQTEVAELLVNLGLAEEVYKRQLTDLIRLGFIDGQSGNLIVDEVGRLLAGDLAGTGLDGKIADYCYSLWQSGRLSVIQPQPANPERIGTLFWFLSRNGRFDQALLVFIELMNRLLDQRRVDEALHYLEQENLFRMNLSTDDMRRRDFFLELTALRAAILLEARDQADLRLVRLKEMQVAGEWEKALLDYVSAQHHYAAFERKLALEAAKRSLISSQAVDSGLLECKADIEIGLTMLASVRLEEAEEYFSLARAAVTLSNAPFEHIRSLTYEAVTHFLFGNISKALSTAEEAGRIAADAGRREWQRLSLLLRGRCYFSLGMYAEARKVFRAGAAFCQIYPNDEAEKVFLAWTARSMAYEGTDDPSRQFEELKRDAEVLFFMSEHSAETGHLARATELVEGSLELQRREEEQYVPSETIPWSSGFAAIEDRALRTDTGRGVLYFNAKAVRAYLKGLGNEVDEAVTEFTRLVREDRLSEHDPNNHYYYYLHSKIVPHGEGELLVDRLTLLSKALKHVQERATRIDDVKKRQSFLHHNLWNARLFEDARSLKLM